ncbi:MAG: hypothetical protein FWD34_01645 [Oscillospiraceae bacterium]|nr:hypothetical protein [Oscillospiraceae bacterium]
MDKKGIIINNIKVFFIHLISTCVSAFGAYFLELINPILAMVLYLLFIIAVNIFCGRKFIKKYNSIKHNLLSFIPAVGLLVILVLILSITFAFGNSAVINVVGVLLYPIWMPMFLWSFADINNLLWYMTILATAILPIASMWRGMVSNRKKIEGSYDMSDMVSKLEELNR